MRLTSIALVVCSLTLLSGCSRLNDDGGSLTNWRTAPASVATLQTPTPTPTPTTPAPTTQAVPQEALSEFIDPSVQTKLSAKDQTEASSAQFYALQYGRPGAPRNWEGDSGASGKVVVGPYVRVNQLDCREFTHTVTLAGKDYPRSGTACREADGTWSVAQSS